MDYWGKNGAGKSTLIKLLAGELTALSASTTRQRRAVRVFCTASIRYLACGRKRFVAFAKMAPQQTEQQLRDYLGSFAFHGDKVNQAAAFPAGKSPFGAGVNRVATSEFVVIG